MSQLLESQQIPKLAGPLAGTLKLQTSGKDWQELLANLNGQFNLHDPVHKADADERLNVDLVVRRSSDVAEAEIRSLQWGSSDLHGQVRFRPGEPPQLTADLESDYPDFDFIREKSAGSARAFSPAGAAGKSEAGTPMSAEAAPARDHRSASVADSGKSSLRLLRRALATPFNLVVPGTNADSKHFFDQEPFRVHVLKALDADIKLHLGRGSGSFGEFRQLALDASLEGGNFHILVSADEINSAPFKLAFAFDSRQTPPEATFNSTLSGFYPGASKSRAPRSVYIDVRAEGNSQAQLAGSMNGEVFLQAGRGETDIKVLGMGFFTGDLLNRVLGNLVPEKSAGLPTLDCGVAYTVINEGVILTPYGMVLQVPDANILIAAAINMKKETIAAQFDSRCRTGAGVSVGNGFSNTVRLSGPLVSPGLVPNTTELAWRSWAALMTGGLSLLGESVAKRMLGSRDPCKGLVEQIQEKVCKPGNTPAASLPLVCGAQ